jgi:hypothetical protein
MMVLQSRELLMLVMDYKPVIPAPGRLKQDDHEFEASMDYIVRP